MATQKLKIALMFNYHQAYYKSPGGEFLMPWVRFYATKDYLDLLLTVRKFPDIRLNINWVPSLLEQIDDYLSHGAKDNIWRLTMIPAEDLTTSRKMLILEKFFHCNFQTFIEPYPRYRELYYRYRDAAAQRPREEIIADFDSGDYRDLQVWYNLTWIGPLSRQRKPIRRLFEKGRDFKETDKAALFSEGLAIMSELISVSRDMWASEQIEISTSPFYHPILPLLVDSQIARESNPETPIPETPIRFQRDAEAQLNDALNYIEAVFARRPRGIWPPEGAISAEVAEMIAKHHMRWIATDERILKESLKQDYTPNSAFQPYHFQGLRRSIDIFFRETGLSDLIGYVYSSWDAPVAVADFIGRLETIRGQIVEQAGEEALSHTLVPIIVSAENCWDYYPQNGQLFLNALFAALSDSQLLETTRLIDSIGQREQTTNLYYLHPGSWVNGNFNIWMGSPEDNHTWELIRQTREYLLDREEQGVLNPEVLAEAWRHMYIAESADWCWWYGNEHTFYHDEAYDQLFREHLMSVYELTGTPAPAHLYQVIKHSPPHSTDAQYPQRFEEPVIDGDVSHFYEWAGAMVFDRSQVMPSIAGTSPSIVERLHVGFRHGEIFLRIDFCEVPDRMNEYVISVKKPEHFQILISPLRGIIERHRTTDVGVERLLLQPAFHQGRILEAHIACGDISLASGDVFGFQLQVRNCGHLLEWFPHNKLIETQVPPCDDDDQPGEL